MREEVECDFMLVLVRLIYSRSLNSVCAYSALHVRWFPAQDSMQALCMATINARRFFVPNFIRKIIKFVMNDGN